LPNEIFQSSASQDKLTKEDPRKYSWSEREILGKLEWNTWK